MISQLPSRENTWREAVWACAKVSNCRRPIKESVSIVKADTCRFMDISLGQARRSGAALAVEQINQASLHVRCRATLTGRTHDRDRQQTNTTFH